MTVAPKQSRNGRADESAFDATALTRSYAFLDDCPARYLGEVITLPVGNLAERVRGVRIWRDALLEGRLPPQNAWPPAEIGGSARRTLEQLGIARFCKDEPELVDDLIVDFLKALRRGHETFWVAVVQRIRELEELERSRLQKLRELALKLDTSPERRRRHTVAGRLARKTLQRLQEQGEREITVQSLSYSDAELMGAWAEPVRVWAEIAEVFGDLGQMMGRGWDLSLGVLHHAGWRDLLRLRELVRALGRLQEADTDDSTAERVFLPMRRLEELRREVRTPLVAADTRGVERSGAVARMLPAEAVMLGHPKLRMLWYARRSEEALLTYRVEGVEIERAVVERETTEESRTGRRPRQRGPILAVIDTSGSMHGLPETVAKALVLEALRTAHAERRQCRVYAFSGPGQVVEEELALSPEGIASLLNFLGCSFGGGSDPAEALSRVLRQLEDGDWAKADVLLVSDGEWPAQPTVTGAVQSARARGVRFHGIQIGNRGHTGLHEVCEPVHVFTDWAGVLDEK